MSNARGARGTLKAHRREYLPEGFMYTSVRKESTLPQFVIKPVKKDPAFAARMGEELQDRKEATRLRLKAKADKRKAALARKNKRRLAAGKPAMPTKTRNRKA